MSVADQLGLRDETSELLALADQRWGHWAAAYPGTGIARTARAQPTLVRLYTSQFRSVAGARRSDAMPL